MRSFNFPASLCSALAILSLSACSADNDQQPTETVTEIRTTAPGEPVTDWSEIEGFWLVLSFGDFEPSWRNGVPWRQAYVQVGKDRLAYSVGCNHSGNPASLGDDAILRDTGDGSRMQTLMGCPPEWEDRDGRFFGFFSSQPKLTRHAEGTLLLKSGAGELVLVRPETWRLANIPNRDFVEDRWVPRMASSYDGWGRSGFGIGDDPGTITISDTDITWSECPDLRIAIGWSADGRLERRDKEEARCPALDRASDNGKSQVLAFLTGNPAVIRTGPAYLTLVLGTGEEGRRLDLQTLDSVRNPPPPPPLPKGMEGQTPPPEPPPPPIGG